MASRSAAFGVIAMTSLSPSWIDGHVAAVATEPVDTSTPEIVSVSR